VNENVILKEHSSATDTPGTTCQRWCAPRASAGEDLFCYKDAGAGRRSFGKERLGMTGFRILSKPCELPTSL